MIRMASAIKKQYSNVRGGRMAGESEEEREKEEGLDWNQWNVELGVLQKMSVDRKNSTAL